MTSLIRTGRGLMTVQTEITGDPAALVTIVDFRGRVLKTWRRQLDVAADHITAPDLAREWHDEVEAQVRANLNRAAKRSSSASEDVVVAHLFAAAMQAYANRDFATAKAVCRACTLLLPEDSRLSSCLQQLRVR
ncbi:hypothetical protein G6O69_32385 [Pseudenhygromyxa sp. WMMC2535]|nr:hypothetical protein [Pseudenhygromyxa sp. WMMC2535]